MEETEKAAETAVEKPEPSNAQQLTKVLVIATATFIVGKLAEAAVEKGFEAHRNRKNGSNPED